MFGNRKDWFNHELSFHRREWLCLGDCLEKFDSQAQFRRHLQVSHGFNARDIQVDHLVQACQQRMGVDSASTCSFCQERIPGRRAIEHHMARHLKDLALWPLPRCETSVEEENEGSDDEMNDTPDLDLAAEKSGDTAEQMEDIVESTSNTDSPTKESHAYVQIRIPSYQLPGEALVWYLGSLFAEALQLSMEVSAPSESSGRLLKNPPGRSRSLRFLCAARAHRGKSKSYEGITSPVT